MLLLFLGWLLGTLSPGIGRAILRRRRRYELLRGLTYECYELRFTVANVLLVTRAESLELDQPTIDLVKPILLGYQGPDDARLTDAMRTLFSRGDAEVMRLYSDERGLKKDQFGRKLVSWPMAYALPLLSSHIGELDLLSFDQQGRFLRVDVELKLFNEQVQYVRALLDRTFTATGLNHQLTETNLSIARRHFATRCDALLGSLNRAL